MSEIQDRLEKIKSHQELCKGRLKEFEDQKRAVYREVAVKFISSIFEFRDSLKPAVVKFSEASTHLRELENLCPDCLSLLEKAGEWDESSMTLAEAKFFHGYLFSSKWKSDAGFWEVLGQISDNLHAVGNPFSNLK